MAISFQPPSGRKVYQYRLNAGDKLDDIACRLDGSTVHYVRELLGWTPYATARAAGLKPNKLKRYEIGTAHLSARDRLQLAAVFKTAGVDIFSGQGETIVALPSSVGGKKEWFLSDLSGTFNGRHCRLLRLKAGLSQSQLERLSGVPQGVISSLECGSKQFHPFLRHRMELRDTLDRNLS